MRTLLFLVLLLLSSCSAPKAPHLATDITHTGDEIIVAGRRFHTGAPVVLWFEPPYYNAYATTRRFTPSVNTPNAQATASQHPDAPTYSTRTMPGNPNSLADLQRHIDQFVIHYDAAGSARQCFKILHDIRGLSVHFLLDTDGTIYQTLDLKERAWHATIANDRSIGIELAHPGAFPMKVTSPRMGTDPTPLAEWYAHDDRGTYLSPPDWLDDPQTRTPDFTPRPARPHQIFGMVQGKLLTQYDFTDEQYDSLIKLTTTLCAIFPEIRLDYPRAASDVGNTAIRNSGSLSRAPRERAGERVSSSSLSPWERAGVRAQPPPLLTHALTPTEFTNYKGILGHYHIQKNKIDPGPAFDWDRVIEGTTRLRQEPIPQE